MMIRNPGVFAAMKISGWIMTGIGKGLIMGFCTYVAMVLADNNTMTGG